MTREEAIERFENVKANALVQKASGVSVYWQNEIDRTVEAIDMAIEALKGGDAEMETEPPKPVHPLYMQQSRHDDGRIEVVRCNVL